MALVHGAAGDLRPSGSGHNFKLESIELGTHLVSEVVLGTRTAVTLKPRGLRSPDAQSRP